MPNNKLQQVNLLPEELRPLNISFSSVHVLYILSFVFVCLVLFGVLSAYQLSGQTQAIEDLKSQQTEMEKRLVTLRQQLARQDTSNIDKKIDETKLRIQRRKNLSRLLGSQEFGNENGFSVHLSALANNHVAGIAIEGFSVNRGGSYLAMSGKARKGELVPQYLGALRQDESLSSVNFGSLLIERDSGRVLDFSVGLVNPVGDQ